LIAGPGEPKLPPMATYAIGDIHGCWHTLQGLLQRIGFAPSRDRLLLTGDLVGRGRFGREVLRWARQGEDHIEWVLGNHEIHLLADGLRLQDVKRRESIRAILDAPDGAELLEWVRRRPLLLVHEHFALVHAGLLPQWSISEAQELAARCQRRLQGDGARALLEASWRLGRRAGSADPADDSLPPEEVLFLHGATLLRLIDQRGEMVEGFVKGKDEIPPGALPWFEAADARWRSHRVIFGHWAMLGLMLRDDVWCLDSACVWGGQLTAVRLDDGRVFQEMQHRQDAPED